VSSASGQAPQTATSTRPPARLSAAPALSERHRETAGGYRHEAFLYCGLAEFLAGAAAFIRRAATAGDPVLAMVSGSKIGMLRRELGPDAANVSFADMTEAGGNPGRMIAVWWAFAQAHAGAAQLWGVGEPVYPGRSAAELAECYLHEALLNVAFDASTPLCLLCPYDLEALTAEVIDQAHRTHPFARRGDDRQPSGTYRPVDLAGPFARPLPPGPPGADGMAFQPGGLGTLKTFVIQHARRAGLDQGSAAAMAVAVHQIAANSLRHGGGHGELRVWREGRDLVCEISDHGHITAPLAGRLPPTPATGSGAGLWLANQLCDLVQIHSCPGRSVIRLHQSPRPAARSRRNRPARGRAGR
jgi:anti-sigma regulatory factor (Ser/Thr protein kinase)